MDYSREPDNEILVGKEFFGNDFKAGKRYTDVVEAYNNCPPGSRVVVRPGLYELNDYIYLQHDIELHLQRGVTLYAPQTFSKQIFQPVSSLPSGVSVGNVVISGEGNISQNGISDSDIIHFTGGENQPAVQYDLSFGQINCRGNNLLWISGFTKGHITFRAKSIFCFGGLIIMSNECTNTQIIVDCPYINFVARGAGIDTPGMSLAHTAGNFLVKNSTIVADTNRTGALISDGGNFAPTTNVIVQNCLLVHNNDAATSHGIDFSGGGAGSLCLLNTAIYTKHASSKSILGATLSSVGSLGNRVTDTITEIAGTFAVDADFAPSILSRANTSGVPYF